MYEHHQATLANLTARFQPDPRFLALIIIGSVARGEARADSDVDFYLVATPEEYQRRQQTGELTIDAQDLADYSHGQASGTIVDEQFMRDAPARAPDPTRFAFSHAFLAYSEIADLALLL